MTDNPTSQELRLAVELLKDGRLGDARLVLIDAVTQYPGNELGWFLLSFAVTDPGHQRDCLERVLRINPGNSNARARFEKLGGVAPPEPIPQPVTPPFVTGEGELVPPEPAPPAQPVAAEGAEAVREPEEKAPFAVPDQHVTPVIFDQGEEGEGETSEEAGEEEQAAIEPAPEPSPAVIVAPAAASPSGPAPTARATMRARPKVTKAKAERPPGWMVAVIVVLLLVILLGAGAVGLAYLRSQTRVGPGGGGQTATAGAAFYTSTPAAVMSLPPEWTHTPTATITLTPSVTPSPSVTATPALPTPNATISSALDLVQIEDADLRGLTMTSSLPRFVISQSEAERTLESAFLAQSSVQDVQDRARALKALGLITPTYDLAKHTLNQMADGIGGFYLPSRKAIFVIGTGLSGVDRFIYSHEYDHALVDANFGLKYLEDPGFCRGDEQRCEAVQALSEGDATLLMQQWLDKYAGEQDLLDIVKYIQSDQPRYALPEDSPPPYASKDASFPYVQGLAFVNYLYARGNWAGVNAAYRQLPDSTAQILHPEKYVSQEKPDSVQDPDIGSALGQGWRAIDVNTLGEWDTYLLLGYGSDPASQLPDVRALAAASGWGGDHLQIYYEDQTDQVAMSVHWVWDSQGDADEFVRAMRVYLGERFRGGKVTGPSQDCWDSNNQSTCLFTSAASTLWVLGPSPAAVTAIHGLYASPL